MAYAFSSKFDVSNLEQLKRNLSRVPTEARNAVRKSNRGWAAKLRDIIRGDSPGERSGKHGAKHDTRPGTIRRGIQSRATADAAFVRGRAPHIMVTEFGGGVFWTRGGGDLRSKHGHKSYKELGALHMAAGGTGHGIFIKARKPDGYFFFPAAREHADDIARGAVDDAVEALTNALA